MPAQNQLGCLAPGLRHLTEDSDIPENIRFDSSEFPLRGPRNVTVQVNRTRHERKERHFCFSKKIKTRSKIGSRMGRKNPRIGKWQIAWHDWDEDLFVSVSC